MEGKVVGITLLICVALTGIAAQPAAAGTTTSTVVVETDCGSFEFIGYFEDGYYIGMDDGLNQNCVSKDYYNDEWLLMD